MRAMSNAVTLASVEQAAYVACTVGGTILVSLGSTHPDWQWVGGVVAILGAIAAALRHSPQSVAVMEKQGAAIDNLSTLLATKTDASPEEIKAASMPPKGAA
jgi:hypothetical protein